jgi:hypothetical protein
MAAPCALAWSADRARMAAAAGASGTLPGQDFYDIDGFARANRNNWA